VAPSIQREATMKPISVQLYSLRKESEADFDGVLVRLAEIGYAGVEPFHLFGMTPRAFRARVEGLGMRISSSHVPWANRAPLNQVVETLGELGLTRAAGGFMPDDFKDHDAILRTAEVTNNLVQALAAHGLTLFLHNHWWEYETIQGGGTRDLKIHLLQDLCPGVQFEVDTYWASNFGAVDVPAEVRRVATRAPLLHIKDGPLVKDEKHVAVGSGVVDIARIVAAADPAVLEWLIVELDACDTDMMTAVAESHAWLTSNGLARGRA
jgi:sugar phosphate isomerase/epimerase